VSGGMQQRTAVARAFAVEPRVLLLDEPFGALDALTRAKLQAQLIELWQSESDTEIVVMVTHGIDEAILLSDRIVVLGNPPGPSVMDVIPVELERPRDRVSVIDDPHYRDIQARLLRLLDASTLEAA
jgi:ABC-type nitrate/sulfonate/bicarbonate transport system ATPase subunit